MNKIIIAFAGLIFLSCSKDKAEPETIAENYVCHIQAVQNNYSRIQ